MTSVVFYFQVHQPYRLARYSADDVGVRHDYFDEVENRRILERVAERSYVPMNRLLGELIEETAGRFRACFSLSGTVLRQLEDWAPEALESFQDLAATGCVEVLGETSMHSLASLGDAREFEAQVEEHRARVEHLFGAVPTSFRNTELIFDERIARAVEDLGFDVLLGEGTEILLGERRPQWVYGVRGCERLALLLRSYEYSDDIAFRFSNREWPAYPLMADTFAGWLDEVPEGAPFVGLFMDYETFGEHQDEGTGIFEFMRHLPGYVLRNPRFDFATPSRVAERNAPVARIRVPRLISWADAERDVSAWLGNPMQREAHAALYDLLQGARAAAAAGRPDLLETWRRLSTSDHVYYMATKFESDAEVHEYFSPHEHPHAAFVTFMNVLRDLSVEIEAALRVDAPTPAGEEP